jgi:hypothetical protein
MPVTTTFRASLLIVASFSLAFQAACGASDAGANATTTARGGQVAGGDGQPFPWQREPGPIAGSWAPTCDRYQGMVVEFVMDDPEANPSPGDAFSSQPRAAAAAHGFQPRLATGRLTQLGVAEKYHYSVGEVIFELEGTMLGKWVGRWKRRTVLRDSRWEMIQLEVDGDKAEAIITNDTCWQVLTRVR